MAATVPALVLRTALLLLALAAVGSARRKLPSFIAKCTSAVPGELNACALKTARNILPRLVQGIPEYKIPPLDPYRVDHLSVQQAGLNIDFRDMTINNLRHFNFTSVKIDLKKHRLDIKTYVPLGYVKAKYNLTGGLLGMKFRGSGDCTFNFYDMASTFWATITMKKNPKDGLDYATISDSDFTYEVSKAQFWFNNLFADNELVTNATNDVLNENWRDVFAETKGGFFRTMDQIVTTELGRIIKEVPYNEIFPA